MGRKRDAGHPDRENRPLGSVGLVSPPDGRRPTEHVMIVGEALA
jgi:hypothetical protein